MKNEDLLAVSKPIEDYALIGNLHCAALVARDGSIDWFCPDRFDAPACFAALLGTREHGHWSITTRDSSVDIRRHYQTDSLVLETHFTTPSGSVRILDVMPIGDHCQIVRIVEGLSGRVGMHMCCRPRFNYGRDHPHSDVLHTEEGVEFAGQDERLVLSSDRTDLTVTDSEVTIDFDLLEREQHWFVLSHIRNGQPFQPLVYPQQAVIECADWWRDWISHVSYSGRWEQEVRRSLITLKALIFAPTGGMVAAPTTSLPEVIGGIANYDYRYCWIRDAAFALTVLVNEGFHNEASAWRDWLLNVVERFKEPLRALYTVDGELAPDEVGLEWLPGYANSRPVNSGNVANGQYQLDVRGELMQVLHVARSQGLTLSDEMWQVQCDVLKFLEQHWRDSDAGMWEFRSGGYQLTHSKVMCWLAFDRCIKDAETFQLAAPIERWRRIRTDIRDDILHNGIDRQGGFFTQCYGSSHVDASLLMLPLVGFLPADDPRMLATVAAVERDLCEDGLVRRYRSGDNANAEGVFIVCCFWLADNYCLTGRQQDAEALFERVLSISNDVGLLAEEYDPCRRRQTGNFPQGLSHLGLISTASLIANADDADVALT